MAFAVEFYRQLMRAQTGLAPAGDPAIVRTVNDALKSRPDELETTAAAIDRSLAALAHIDRNAHQATLIECWLDDLARIAQTGVAVGVDD